MPYATAAVATLAAGYAPLPSTPGSKSGNIPSGFTGYGGQWPSGADVHTWLEDRGRDNIVARLPRNAVGIDVDAYGQKSGAATLDGLQRRLGALPSTWRVSARFGDHYDNASGIRLFTLPEHYADRAGEPGWITGWADVDLVRYAHRYIVAPPSIHPSRGAAYRVLDEATGELLDALPPVASLPMLPESWCAELLQGGRTRQRTDAPASQWWSPGAPCPSVAEALGKSLAELSAGSRHDAALAALLRLTRLGEQGHEGVQRAIDTLRGAFVLAITGDHSRTAVEADAEWSRMVVDVDSVLERQGLTNEDKRGCFHAQPVSQLPSWEPDLSMVPESEPSSEAASSWQPVDLTAVIDGTHRPEEATLLQRSDGVGLWYAGRTHSLHGESESGKSLVAQAASAQVMQDGGSVLYVDCESDAVSVVTRLRALGATDEALAHRFTYLRPDEGLSAPRSLEAFLGVLDRDYQLAVVDGVTEAMSLLGGGNGTPEEQAADYDRRIPRRIATRTGAAVVQVDHVTKSTEGRGRFALGSQHKMSALTGAAYTVEVTEPLGLGLRGVVVLRIAKDRPGTVRPHCGNWRKSDRTQEAARVVFDATQPGATIVAVEPPSGRSEAQDDTGHAFRPTVLMERVSRYVEGMVEPVSGRAINDNVQGNGPAIRTALDVLVDEGYMTRTPGARNALLHVSVKPYRQVSDPRSDAYLGMDALKPFDLDLDPSTASATASPTMSGDAGRTQKRSGERVLGRTGTQSERSGTHSPADPHAAALEVLHESLGATVA